MNNILITVPAHFDGEKIQLDVDVELKPTMKLLVTILAEEVADTELLHAVMQGSEPAFARVWDNEDDAIYDNL
jgi:hypothetical protein